MNSERMSQLDGPQEAVLPLFEKRELKSGVMVYAFKNVAVAIDTTGKNYQGTPEILFGTFDADAIDWNDVDTKSILSQPETKREGVDMNHVAACIREVVKDSGISEFWMCPFGDDAPGDKVTREQARLRLFSRYLDINQAPGGFGYIVRML